MHTFNFVSLKRCAQPYRSSLRATEANQHHRWARAAIEEPDVAKTMYENTCLVLIFLEKPSVQLFVLLRYSIQIVPLKSPINRNYRSPQEKPKTDDHQQYTIYSVGTNRSLNPPINVPLT